MDESLNDIKLSPEMLSAFYGRSLVSAVDHTAVKALREDQVAIRFLGNNARNITILVRNPGHSFMPEAELNFLTKMLEACRMNIGDVAIVNLAEFDHALGHLVARLSPSQVISFGARPGKLHFSQHREQQVDILDAPSLAEMLGETNEARQMKSKLWVTLKQIFNL
jgi:hypothetical protein